MLSKKKKQGLRLMILSVTLIIISLLFQNIYGEDVPIEDWKIEIGNFEFKLEKLDSDEKRIKGLSGREGLSADEGVLFVFEDSDLHGFWMKDMNFPISIIWLDEECKVSGFKKDATPTSYPEVFYPELPSMYVVEINPLNFDLKIGDATKCSFLPKN